VDRGARRGPGRGSLPGEDRLATAVGAMPDRNGARRLLTALVLWFAALPAATAAAGALPDKSARPCPGPVAALPPARAAAFAVAALRENDVRLTFIGHATFLIESPHGVRIATDYNDAVGLPVMPDIVTMNHAHPTHYTEHPDPGIKIVLRGWNDDGSPAVHDLVFGDVRVRNVPTNLRAAAGGTERYGNSVFVFEVASLCIVHLGHLHHTLTPEQLAAIGPVDVVMAPVDGTYTLDLAGMIEVLRSLKAALIVPMHFFGASGLERFLAVARPSWPIEMEPTPSVVVSRATLPSRATVLVLPGS
jgi:L-ascorbate metabolism protein UlaG (beta-lactamase superfamily)